MFTKIDITAMTLPNGMRCVRGEKNDGHTYILLTDNLEAGREAIRSWNDRKDLDFDWIDAARMRKGLGRRPPKIFDADALQDSPPPLPPGESPYSL